jgi:plasmid maintenance system antidote protein VapI
MQTFELLKGIHPGAYLERELKNRHIPKGKFAMAIGEYPQTFTAIMKGRRSMNTPLSIRIEDALGLEEGFLMSLQVHFDIKQERAKQHESIRPQLNLIRKALFWDTNMENIDWIAQKDAIWNRIMERGNAKEKEEIRRFYNSFEVQRLLNPPKLANIAEN